jgi:hypothetical protein
MKIDEKYRITEGRYFRATSNSKLAGEINKLETTEIEVNSMITMKK